MQGSPDGDHTFLTGFRYIPQLNYQVKMRKDRLFDLEVSVNLDAEAGFRCYDQADGDVDIAPYRMWVRYSTRQFELRAGLQKINFGSATYLRPLSWFDQMDPRDPLLLTKGVWGVLGRYYFLNNSNLWLWVLYGNEKTKTWEIAPTSLCYPEAGARFQQSLPKGETALSYHFRVADASEFEDSLHFPDRVPEHRIGLDGKWDVGVGLWFESAWITKTRDIGVLSNQFYLTAGCDYTFRVGNGLNVILEQMVASFDRKPFLFTQPSFFTAFSASYPLSLFDNLGVIMYYDWTNRGLYNFVTWSRQFSEFSLYVMGYWNPRHSYLPQMGEPGQEFAGKGIRIMAVIDK